MNRVWLIQRLKIPPKNNPKNSLWIYDYMGASQFVDFGDVKRVIKELAGGERIIRTCDTDTQSLRLREPSYFKEALEGTMSYEKLGGWLELDNRFMFFVNELMYQRTLSHFKIPTERR